MVHSQKGPHSSCARELWCGSRQGNLGMTTDSLCTENTDNSHHAELDIDRMQHRYSKQGESAIQWASKCIIRVPNALTLLYWYILYFCAACTSVLLTKFGQFRVCNPTGALLYWSISPLGKGKQDQKSQLPYLICLWTWCGLANNHICWRLKLMVHASTVP